MLRSRVSTRRAELPLRRMNPWKRRKRELRKSALAESRPAGARVCLNVSVLLLLRGAAPWVSIAGLGLALMPAVAAAKGGTGQVQAATSAQLTLEPASQLGVRGCLSPGLSACESLSYATSACGRQEALRATGTPGYGDCFDLCAQATPTLDDCRNEAWLNSVCGQLERQRMDLDPVGDVHPSTCFELMRPLGDDIFQGAPTQTVMVPPEVSCDGCATPTNAPLSLTTARRLDDERSDYNIEAPTSTYYGELALDFTHRSKPPRSHPHQSRFDALRQAWAANGSTVGSCLEYVYEKYYNFNAYMDRAAAVAPDHRAMFDLAYEEGNRNPQAWAVGLRGVQGIPVQHFATTIATDPQPELPSEVRGRNVFFDPEVMSNSERASLRQAFEAGAWPLSRPVGYGLFVFDDDLHQRLTLGAFAMNRVVKDFAYHRAMGEALTPDVIEPQFRLYEGARRRFVELTRRRALIWVAWAEFLTRYADKWTEAIPEIQVLYDPAEGLLDPTDLAFDPVAKTLKANRDLKVQRRQAHGLRTSVTRTRPALQPPARAPLGSAVQLSADDPAGLVSDPGLLALIAETVEANDPALIPYESCNGWQCFFEAIAQTEALMEQALLAARDLGCLDVGSPPHPCDWSPLDFVEALGDPYETVREPEYRACVEKTPGQDPFDNLRNADFDIGNGQVPSWDGQPCSSGDYTVSIPMVERYFECRVEWVKAVLEYLESQLDEPDLFEPGPPRQLVVGKQDADHMRVGNNMFGAQLDYDVGWSVPGNSLPMPGTRQYCALRPNARASMSARGRALFLEKELVEASAEVGLGRGSLSTAYLEIAGQEIFHPDPVKFNTTAFNPVLEASDGISEDIVKASATITVVFVPVKIAGGIAGSITAGVALSAGAQKGSSCNNGDLGLSAEFKPTAALEAFASASIDAVIVEAGVQIWLVIISLELPLTAGLTFDGVVIGGTVQDTRLSARTSLDFVLRMLSGRVSAFVEVCYLIDCSRAEAELFSWSGPSLTENIFETTFEVPVEAMSILQHNPGGN